jgi:hypothetical protein
MCRTEWHKFIGREMFTNYILIIFKTVYTKKYFFVSEFGTPCGLVIQRHF